MPPVIQVEGLSKLYRVGSAFGPARLSETLVAWSHLAWRRLRRAAASGSAHEASEFWALKDVSLTVGQGEVVGIVGHNGAGKSTLLKILARIVHPTEGRFAIRGRLASLIEIGTGFHPELTGRENVYLSGCILGLTHREVQRRFDEIVAFSGVERFLDTPVKRYSSGMHVRLGFSVAAHLDPEVMILDEALSVGDAAFQQKCQAKIDEIRHSGRTILLVSHSMTQIVSLCHRAIWLHAGQVRDEGPPTDVVHRYLAQSTVKPAAEGSPTDLPSDANVRVRELSLAQPGTRGAPQLIDVARDCELSIVLELLHLSAEYSVRLLLVDEQGTIILGSESTPFSAGRNSSASIKRITCRIPANLLAPIDYHLRIHVRMLLNGEELVMDPALAFRGNVLSAADWTATSFAPGLVHPRLTWSMSHG